MVNFKINDQYCLNKIKNYFNYNLSSRLSFSDSNLNHLNRPLKSDKINSKYKLKYLNCLKVSAKIFYRAISSRFNLDYPRNLKKLYFKKKMNNFFDSRALSFANLNEFNRPNLMMFNKELTQSDPELYSTNLFSYMGDSENNDEQFFLKTIYSTCKSLNFLKLFMKRKKKFKDKNYKTEIDEDLIDLSDSLNDQLFLENNNRIFDNLNDSLDKFQNESLKSFYDNNDLLNNFKDNSKKNDFKDLKEINLNQDDLVKEIFSNKQKHNESISSLDQDQLNYFFNLKELNDLNRKKDLKVIDQSTQTDLSINDFKELKPTKSTTYFPSFFKLNILDNFFNKVSSTNELTSSSTKECICKNNQNKLNHSDNNKKSDDIKLNTKNTIDQIDIIDLNDVNNFKFYKDPLLSQFDLDIKEQEIINYDFDEKFEKFLRYDLERLNRSKCKSNNLIKNDQNLSINNSLTIKDQNKFDSMKCLNLFKSKIPVLKRDKSKFSESMLDKLKIKYDPLKIRQKSKLIDVLNEDYRKKIENNKLKSNVLNRKDNKSIKSFKSLKSLKQIKDIKNENLIKKNSSLNCLNSKLNKTDDNIKLKVSKDIDNNFLPINKEIFNLNLKDNNLKKQISNQNKFIYHLKPSRIPRMNDEESIPNHQLLLNRKQTILKIKKDEKKGDKLFKLIKDIGFLKDTVSTDESEYQCLKKCVPRTKSESFIDEQLDSERINENFRQQLLNLEFKTNGNCLFQLYDYFDNFKDKKRQLK